MAFDLEWNSKDQTFDRDLLAMRTYFDCGLIDVGVIVTRAKELNDVFKDEKILLVQEKDGRWSLPGGWVDFDLSIRENTVKEVKEEAGLDVECQKLIALHDRKKHNLPIYPYNICKVFVLCKLIGGQFKGNSETIGSQYFALDELPELSGAKNTAEQIALCFQAKNDPNWQVVFD